MIKTINFAKAPRRLSRGRNGFFKTSGIEIFLEQFGATNEPNQDDCVSFYSITSKGKASEAARIAISVEALPAVIEALQELLAQATKTNLFCSECGGSMYFAANDVLSHHGEPGNTDFNADADHVALAEP